MRVAVMMSAYNGEKYIREQIDSIINQVGDFQLDLWVRDDGSTDSTKEILEEYALQGILQWYAGENLKPAHSFLDLLKHCSGYDYYAFADQDDHWMRDKINTAVQSLISIDHSIKLYCGNAELVNYELVSLNRIVYSKTPSIDFKTLTCAGGILGCTMVFNDGLAKLVQGNALPNKIVLHDFYLAALCVAFDGKIIFDEKVYIKYRQHQDNVVGISSGTLNILKSRFHDISQKPLISIADQAESILNIYDSILDHEKCRWLNKIKNYQSTFLTRSSLALSRKTKYININMGFKIRMSILLGNR